MGGTFILSATARENLHETTRYLPTLLETLDRAEMTVCGKSAYSVGRKDRAGLAVGEIEAKIHCARACLMMFTRFFERGSRDARAAGKYGESNAANSALSGRVTEEEELR